MRIRLTFLCLPSSHRGDAEEEKLARRTFGVTRNIAVLSENDKKALSLCFFSRKYTNRRHRGILNTFIRALITRSGIFAGIFKTSASLERMSFLARVSVPINKISSPQHPTHGDPIGNIAEFAEPRAAVERSFRPERRIRHERMQRMHSRHEKWVDRTSEESDVRSGHRSEESDLAA